MRPIDEQIDHAIRAHGWWVLNVASGDHDPGFAYSVGLVKTFDHPEIHRVRASSRNNACNHQRDRRRDQGG